MPERKVGLQLVPDQRRQRDERVIAVRRDLLVRRDGALQGGRDADAEPQPNPEPVWLGRALIERVHTTARELGIKEIELHVYEFNEAGLHVYQRLGYRGISRRMRKILE